jgi:hypothetical protein
VAVGSAHTTTGRKMRAGPRGLDDVTCFKKTTPDLAHRSSQTEEAPMNKQCPRR